MEKLHCSRKIGVSLLGITFALVLGIIVSRIDGTFLLARSNNDVTSYSLTLSNSNKYSGSATKQISTDSGGSKVQFSYTLASSSASGHVKLSADGTIKNDTQITSITNILPSFTCNNGISLKFRASFDGNKWGDYTSLASGSSFDLSESKPYFIEFKADGGTVDVNAIKFTYSCMDNPSAHGESGPSEFKKVTSDLADFSGTYLIVYTEGQLAFDGSLDKLDDTNNNFSVSIKNDSITYSQEIASKTFEIAKSDGGYSIKASNGKYIGNNSNSNALTANDGELKNTISYSDDTLDIISYGGAYLRYNASNDQSRFRYFKSSTYTGQKPIDLYKLENGGTIIGTPSYEVGLTVTDSKSSSYTVNDTFNSFVTNGGLTATAKMSDGSTKTLNKSEFSYILNYQGEVVDSSKTFAHAGTYDVYVSYKSLVPVKYSITVANVVTSITANKTKTTYSVGDAISLSDITVTKNYKVDGSSVVINYADFSSNGLSCELKNPNEVVVSSGTFNIAGNWSAKVYLTSNPSISSSISISVSTVEVTSISLNKSNTTISIGNNETLVATVLPSNATNKNVTWTSSESTVASVINGIVTGVSEGNATITAKAGNFSATCFVTVEKVHVTGISLTETTKSLDVGSSSTLTATITPSNATDKSVTWTSSDTGVASVNANGVISALKAGTTIITVRTNDGGKTASCILTVKNVDVTSITLSQTSLELYINGNSETLTATILPDNATIKTITWTSSDSSVASVNNGVVTPMGAGTTTITASCGGKSATCTVTVSSEPQVKRGTAQFNFFNYDAIDVTNGTNADTTYVLSKLSFSDDSLKASEFLSSFNSNGTVQYDKNGGLTIGASKNSASATFNFTSDYKITKVEVVGTVYDSNIALKLNDSTGEGSLNPKGTNLLSCSNTLVWDNLDKLSSFTLSSSKRTIVYTLKCYYEASQQGGGGEENVPVTGISVSPTSQTLVVDQTLQLNPTITPSNATDKSVSYSSSNVTVASVSSSGIVTAKNSGNAIITVTSNYDRSISATCNITVQEASVSVTSVSLSSSSETISVGGSITLTATISPSNATNKNVTWSSTDSSVASVYEGVVTGIKTGTTSIKVTTQDGNKTASCSITVTSGGGQTTDSITIVSDDAPDKYDQILQKQ
ncbi:MAG: Ig-like domain-containing protein [Bacilli bacterium]|nr:Ig-like domain-containing protein [Bacilli bacterium]